MAVVRKFRTTQSDERASCCLLDGRRVLIGHKLRPDQMPVIRPKIATGNGAAGGALDADAKLCADAMPNAYRLAQVSDRRTALRADLFAFGIRCGVQVLQELVHGHMLPMGKVSVNTRRQFTLQNLSATMSRG